MKLEVLLSCMNQEDFSITKNMNLSTDILILNQCGKDYYTEKVVRETRQRMISSSQKGLSRSRNELLLNMHGDIGIFCDDDVIYFQDYEKKIITAFEELKDADIIIFDTEMINFNGKKRKKNYRIKRAPRYKNYGSVRIAFRKESFYKNNLWFNLNFGAGSRYSSGEESLLLREANRKKLKIYEYPATIAKVDYSVSTWFRGYDEKFFFDKGAWLKEAYPKAWFIYMWYFVYKFYIKEKIKINKILKNIFLGIRDYKNLKDEE